MRQSNPDEQVSLARRLTAGGLVFLGWLALGAGFLVFLYDGYVEDYGLEPLRTLDEAIPIALLGLLLVGWAGTVETVPGAPVRPRLVARLKPAAAFVGAVAGVTLLGWLIRSGTPGIVAANLLVGAATGIGVVAFMRRRR